MNHGVGVMFLPSGLGYFATGAAGIPAYSPLVFKFDLLQMKQNDHDNDGIPSYKEDLNGDGEFTVANADDDTITHDDTDGDSIPNYFDSDDDADGVLTIDELNPTTYIIDTNQGQAEPNLAEGEFEISRSEEAGVITIKTVTIMDTNNNGKGDHLDDDITINYNE